MSAIRNIGNFPIAFIKYNRNIEQQLKSTPVLQAATTPAAESRQADPEAHKHLCKKKAQLKS